MTTSEENQLKIKINTLQETMKNLEKLKDKARAKEEMFRKVALTATISGGLGHMFGYLIHPLFVVASITAMCATVVPSGILMFVNQDKADKYEELIKTYKREIDEAKNKIEFSAEAIFDLTTSINKKENNNIKR